MLIRSFFTAHGVRLFPDPAGNNGGGGGGGGDGDNRGGIPAGAMPRNPAEWKALAEALVDKHGSADRAVQELARANFRARRQRDEFKAKAGTVPEGAVVLTGDEAKAVEALRTAGVKLTDVKATLDRVPTLETENRELRSQSAAVDAGRKLNFNPDAIRRIMRSDEIALEEREVNVKRKGEGGKDVTVREKRWCAVKPGDDKFTPLPFEEYVEQHAPDMRDALRIKPAAGTPAAATWPAQSAATQHTTPSRDGGSREPETGDPIASFTEQVNKRSATRANPFAVRGGGVAGGGGQGADRAGS